jgi:hypothetical protein
MISSKCGVSQWVVCGDLRDAEAANRSVRGPDRKLSPARARLEPRFRYRCGRPNRRASKASDDRDGLEHDDRRQLDNRWVRRGFLFLGSGSGCDELGAFRRVVGYVHGGTECPSTNPQGAHGKSWFEAQHGSLLSGGA